MANNKLNFSRPNEAWIFHRTDMDVLKEGSCNVFFLIDAYSSYCFDQFAVIDIPTPAEITKMLNKAHIYAKEWPKQILIDKKNPCIDLLKSSCASRKIQILDLSTADLKPFVRELVQSLNNFMKTGSANNQPPLTSDEEAEVMAMIPDPYDPCPCASDKKYKFCCQKIFKEVTFAMTVAQDGHLEKALGYMKAAESKVGKTAEILCRYAIVWSFFDKEKSFEFLKETLKVNPNHPRANYVLGIESMAECQHEQAVIYYLKAIEHYPAEDKYHLNEVYNNLGTAYFALKKYFEAKSAWEKAVVLMPKDEMSLANLFEMIYQNPDMQTTLRQVSPFMQKYISDECRHN